MLYVRKFKSLANMFIIKENIKYDIAPLSALTVIRDCFKREAPAQLFIYLNSSVKSTNDIDSRVKIDLVEDYFGKALHITRQKSFSSPEYIVRSPEEASKIIEKIYQLAAFE